MVDNGAGEDTASAEQAAECGSPAVDASVTDFPTVETHEITRSIHKRDRGE